MSCIMTGGMSSSHVDYHSKLVMRKDGNNNLCMPTGKRQHIHKKNIEFLQFDMAVAHNFFIQ